MGNKIGLSLRDPSLPALNLSVLFGSAFLAGCRRQGYRSRPPGDAVHGLL